MTDRNLFYCEGGGAQITNLFLLSDRGVFYVCVTTIVVTWMVLYA